MKLAKIFMITAALVLFEHSTAFADAVLTVVPVPGTVLAGQTFTVGIFVTFAGG